MTDKPPHLKEFGDAADPQRLDEFLFNDVACVFYEMMDPDSAVMNVTLASGARWRVAFQADGGQLRCHATPDGFMP